MVEHEKEAGGKRRRSSKPQPQAAPLSNNLEAPEVERRPLIVGIGASAGGLDAFKAFFESMPSDSGMAFVLVQHLNPEHKSILTDLIARQTTMPVEEAKHGTPIRANAIFVIPPNATLTITDGLLQLEQPAPPRQNRFPIDSLFISLADGQSENAVGIVLAGTGSDGTIGVRAIKAQGGLTLAQAGFDHLALSGMPQSAAATGLVDHVMQVSDMPAQLINYQHHLNGVAPLKDGDGTRRDLEGHLTTISTLLRAVTGHDFTQYKYSTLGRRVQRRMQVLQIDTVPAFIERLRTDPLQLDLLFREFLIGVTQFFRDGNAFEALRTAAIPRLLATKAPQDPFRVWVPACATGEEVYSIAILLKEAIEQRGISLQVQIFGTDIDDAAVATARTAYYPKLPAGLSPERIERWFVRHGDGHSPVRQIREMCVFSLHSVTRDPPFSKLDLISCRNLLIYLDAELQERVVRTFHYALRPDGILFLGPSEGLTRGTKLFSLLDKRHRLFERRTLEASVRPPDFAMFDAATGLRGPAPRPPATATGEDRIDRNARDILEKYTPAYVVVDPAFEVLRFSGGAIGRYLEPSAGPPSLNLFSLLRKTLRPVVRAAVQTIFSEGRPVLREELSIKLDGESRIVAIIVEPLHAGRSDRRLCLVAFQDLGPVGRRRQARRTSGPAEIEALEQELGMAKTQLMSATTDLEGAHEEAASAAEEYRSVNEELQSSNEELETAKEEMQSINEELQTVNAELNSKNDLLIRSNSDLQNFLDSTEIATIFLDDNLHVKGYTPGMTELFHLRDADRGRPLDEIVSRLVYHDLRDDVLSVLRELKFVEREVEIANESLTFIMRIRPYRRLDKRAEGVVITFVDISERRKAEEVLREHAAIVEFSQDALLSLTLGGVIRSWNPGAQRLFGYSAREAIGRSFSFLASAKSIDAHNGMIEQAKAGTVAGPIGTSCLRKDGGDIAIELSVMPIRGNDGAVTTLALSARDIAERKSADAQRILLLAELSHRVKNALATVQAVATETLRSAPTPEAFTTVFSARLLALAGTHDILTRAEWQGAALREALESELAPYQNDEQSRWCGTGPVILLDAKTTLALGMAFHELATNAAKYGALSLPGGCVNVTWEVRKRGTGNRLYLVWAENGGPAVKKPDRRGFGTRLIADGVGYELDGIVELDFDVAGLRCIIDVPLNIAGGGA
jgi:two-component system CheB/CheR fusion protein